MPIAEKGSNSFNNLIQHNPFGRTPQLKRLLNYALVVGRLRERERERERERVKYRYTPTLSIDVFNIQIISTYNACVMSDLNISNNLALYFQHF